MAQQSIRRGMAQIRKEIAPQESEFQRIEVILEADDFHRAHRLGRGELLKTENRRNPIRRRAEAGVPDHERACVHLSQPFRSPDWFTYKLRASSIGSVRECMISPEATCTMLPKPS